ncbi:MAG: hypothetical protein V7L29_13355 [Nostoc sp.]
MPSGAMLLGIAHCSLCFMRSLYLSSKNCMGAMPAAGYAYAQNLESQF